MTNSYAQEGRDADQIRQLVDRLVQSIRSADLDGLKSCFAPDMVSFDVGPPLQHVGVRAKLKNWEQAFAVFPPPLNYEIRDLAITTGGGDVAFAHGFGRLSGTLNGTQFGPWVRYTSCLRKIDGAWLIAHDHVSAPTDFANGTAMLNLEP